MPETVESTAPVEPSKPGDATFWLSEIDASLKRQERWIKRADKVVKRYRDERDNANAGSSKINILWSNTEVLKGALYARTAKADVRRRFPDTKGKSPVYRAVAEILERGLDYCADAYDVDAPLSDAVADTLLPGRGTVWVVYDPELTEGGVGKQPLMTDYVYWKDFAHGQARRWGGVAGVPWVARRLPQRKADVEEKWPDAAKTINFDYQLDDGKHEKTGKTDQFAEIWEIWDRESRRRIYVARDYPKILQEDDDPLKLQGFFPCPMPLYSVTTTDGLIPVPEFSQYQDQANQLDKISTRIDKLLGALKWAGIYDAAADDGNKALAGLANVDDNTFLPHQNFQQIRDKGGIESAFGFIPIDKIAPVVAQLQEQKQLLIQEIYQITGISDIIRGATDPRETKGAQQLKAQFGSMRMQSRQREVQRFIRDTYRIKAEIIAEHWTRETIAAVTGIELPLRAEVQQAQAVLQFQAQVMAAQQSQRVVASSGMPGGPPAAAPPAPDPRLVKLAQAKIIWEDVEAVLRSDERRAYAVDIETDSTVMQDAEVEKASRIEFMTATREMLADAFVAIQQAPMLAKLVKELTLFGLRTFKPGRHLEEAFEETFDQLAEQPPQQPEQEQDDGSGAAAMAEVQRKAKRDEAEIAIEGQRAKSETDNERVKTIAGIAKTMADIKNNRLKAQQRPAA